MSKKLSQEEVDELALKKYVEECFKEMDEALSEWAEDKERERAAKEAEEARAAERAAVNRQKSEASVDELAVEEETKNANKI